MSLSPWMLDSASPSAWASCSCPWRRVVTMNSTQSLGRIVAWANQRCSIPWSQPRTSWPSQSISRLLLVLRPEPASASTRLRTLTASTTHPSPHHHPLDLATCSPCPLSTTASWPVSHLRHTVPNIQTSWSPVTVIQTVSSPIGMVCRKFVVLVWLLQLGDKVFAERTLMKRTSIDHFDPRNAIFYLIVLLGIKISILWLFCESTKNYKFLASITTNFLQISSIRLDLENLILKSSLTIFVFNSLKNSIFLNTSFKKKHPNFGIKFISSSLKLLLILYNVFFLIFLYYSETTASPFKFNRPIEDFN